MSTFGGQPELLQEVLSAKPMQRFHARGISQSGGSLTEYHIEVDRSAQAWFMIAVGTDLVIEHREGTTYTPEGSWQMGLMDYMPWPLSLAFLESVKIWGRPSDDFEPVSTERLGNHCILITAQNVADHAMRATAVFDRRTTMFTKLIRPTDANQLDAIQPGLAMTRGRSFPPTFQGFEPPDY